MKKICFITPIYLPANLFGSDTYIDTLAKRFAKENCDVSIITSNAGNPSYWYNWFERKIRKKYELINGVNVYRLPCSQLFFILNFVLARIGFFFPQFLKDKFWIASSGPYLFGLATLLEKIQPDIIHCSPAPLQINIQTVEAIKSLKKKPTFIFTPFFHSQVPFFNNSLLQYVFDNADIVHVVTSAEKEEIIARFTVSEHKFSIIPLFIETDDLHGQEELAGQVKEFKEKYKLKDKRIILFAGIKGQMKGAIDLISVVNDLYIQGEKIILVAIGHSTTEWEKIKKTINVNCLLDFRYVGKREKELLFAACDVFCMPSKSETFGLVYLEAWHKGKAVIAADIPTMNELIGKQGLLVEFANRPQLKKILKSLENDTNKMHYLGEAGNRKLKTSYIAQKIFPKYSTLFNV